MITRRLEVMRYSTPRAKTAIEALGRQGLVFARAHDHPRHASLIEQLLSEALD